nr:MAG TPA: hypothetical protein [Bacteriophage sp.]
MHITHVLLNRKPLPFPTKDRDVFSATCHNTPYTKNDIRNWELDQKWDTRLSQL